VEQFVGLVNQQERCDMNKLEALAYHYGVFLGDGFIERYSKNSSCMYIGLKSVDLDLLEHWRDTMSIIADKVYKIRKETEKKGNCNTRWRCRVGKGSIVQDTIKETSKKTKAPTFILEGNDEIKKQFIQGLMDAEAWITFSLKPLGFSSMILAFAVTEAWIFDFHKLFKTLNIKTTRVIKKHGKNGKKDLFYFHIDILDYVNSGLGFNIKRKQDRLDYCTNILTDYTQNYPRYKDYFE